MSIRGDTAPGVEGFDDPQDTDGGDPFEPSDREMGEGDEPDLAQGEVLGDHVVVRTLGRGSHGVVYEARHQVLARVVAIKLLTRSRSRDRRAVDRFVSEARLASALQHENVVAILGFGALPDGRRYLVMERVVGDTLDELLDRRGALPLAEAVPILRGIAAALDAVHEAGIAHRDLKPANVVLEARDGELVPKLIDFGIAKLLPSTGPSNASVTAGFLGTPRYMSPEQCRGNPVGTRADAYAFGVLAYEMLAGAPPFDSDDPLEVMLCHAREAPPPISSRGAAVPAGVEAMLLPLLAKDPSLRPPALVPVVARLAALLVAPSPSRGRSALRGGARVRRSLFLALGALAALGALLVSTRGGSSGEPPARPSPAATEAPEVAAMPPAPVPVEAAASVSPPSGAASARPALRDPAPRGVPPSGARDPSPAPGLDDPEDPYRSRLR